MIRTQIQLEEHQYHALKAKASAEGLSIAELVRRGIDTMLNASGYRSYEERRRRAIKWAGKFSSGVRDLSADHDRHLEEAYGE
ncbi:MAG: CopG family transcriptional regulator [Candidatus Eremiobacteraeota bacterium]|nr:CopG family transcriptional regulator [Candidatus Eremiobacteraeota bacterium]